MDLLYEIFIFGADPLAGTTELKCLAITGPESSVRGGGLQKGKKEGPPACSPWELSVGTPDFLC